jgi:dTDP-4-amino-4,6-dideoxygalactose transaminase
MAKLSKNGGIPVINYSFPGWPQVTENDETKLRAVYDSKKINSGAAAEHFSRRFAAYCGTKHCIPVANGTVSLELILRGLGIGYGDEVILPPYTFIATLSSVIFASAKPVFADIDRHTYNISPSDVLKKITDRTRAVVAVAIGGRPIDIDELERVSLERGIYIIIDAAQAVGARRRDISIGKCGTAASFSCQNSKNLTSGEGGIITTDSDELYDNISVILNGGRRGSHYIGVGQDYGMTELQASLLDSQADKLGDEIIKRSDNAAYLDLRLRSLPFIKPTDSDANITTHAYHLYIARLNYELLESCGVSRGVFLEALRAEGVPFDRGYMPLYTFPCTGSDYTTRRVGSKIDLSPLPECEIASYREGIWAYQSMLLGTHADMDNIADAFEKVYGNLDELKGGN